MKKIFIVLILFLWIIKIAAQNSPVWHTSDLSSSNGTGTSLSVAQPANLSSGDLIVLIFTQQRSPNSSSSGFSTPTDFTLIRSEHAQSQFFSRVEVVAFYKIATASEPANYTSTVFESGNTAQWKAIAGRVTGHDSTNPIGNDSGTNSNNNSVTSITIPTLSTTNDNSLLIAARSVRASLSTEDVPAGMSLEWTYNGSGASDGNDNAPAFRGASETITTAGATGTKQFSWNTSARAAALMFSINPSPVSTNLSITKVVDDNTPPTSSNVVFTLTAANSGTSDATGVVVNDILPDGYSYVSHLASTGSYNNVTGVWNIGNVINGDSETLEITAEVLCAGTYDNTATISGNESDPVSANNTSTIVVNPTSGTCPVFAYDDNAVVTTSPVEIDVLGNDVGTLDVTSVSTSLPLTQPTYGSVVVNPTGTITYSPGVSYAGTDVFQYEVCSSAYPTECDIATVNISDCTANTDEYIVSGIVFIEQLPDDSNYDFSESSKSGITVNLYDDPNCNGALDDGQTVPLQTIVSSSTGDYEFIIPGLSKDSVLDEFSSSSYANNDGNVSWSADWVENDPYGIVGPTVDDYVGITGGELFFHYTYTEAESAQRSVDLTGATSALLTLDWRTVFSQAGSEFHFRISSDGTNFTTIGTLTISPTSGSFSYDITSYISATTTVRFVNTGADWVSGEYAYIDNVQILYETPVSGNCFITQVDVSDQNGIYTPSSLETDNANFSILGSCDNSLNLGILAVIDAVDDIATVIASAVEISILTNDIGNFDLSSITTSAPLTQPSFGSVVVNPTGTITYSPGGSYTGSDVFQYKVFSSDDPQVYDIATVTVSDCSAGPAENLIGGLVFLELTPDDGSYTIGETLKSGITVDLYADANCNQSVDAGESTPVQSVSTDGSGNYTFTVDNTYDCYIVKTDLSNQSGIYDASLLSQQEIDFTGLGLGNCNYDNNLGIISSVDAINDSETTPINTPIIISVLSNDIGSFNLASVTNSGGGLIQPQHGSNIVNGDGTITYTPDFGYTGSDFFTYQVCSDEDPSVCDIAQVDIIIGCPAITNQNTIYGTVFEDLNTNGIYENSEAYTSTTVTINLYTDGNANGIIDDGATAVPTTTDGSGNYQFAVANQAGSYIVELVTSSLPAGNTVTTPTTQYVLFSGQDQADCSNNFGFSFCVYCYPVAIDDYETGSQGTPLIFNVLDNDIETTSPIDVSSLAILNGPYFGTLIPGSNGQVTYLPNSSFIGSDYFEYKICDTSSPSSLCDTAFAYITVEENNSDPCAEAVINHTFYLPYPAENLYTALRNAINCPTNLGNNLRTVVSIKCPYGNVVFRYDHWEDGYEADLQFPTQATTEIWGDGDLTNGVAPGYANDTIPSGGSIILDNVYGYNPRLNYEIVYDGKDKIYTTAAIALSVISGDNSQFAVQAAKTDVYDVNRFGTFFIVAFGEDLGNEFQYTSLFVRASENFTEVTIDVDGDGTINTGGVDVVSTIHEGEVIFIDGGIQSGATVYSDKPVGVDVLFGGLDCYGTRNISLLPGEFYGDTYFTPVYTTNTGAPAAVYFYNSSQNDITINWTSSSGNGSFIIPALDSYKFSLPLAQTGYKFVSTGEESYVAVEVIDSDASGATYDWAFTLISKRRLTDFASVAWAPGSIDGTRNDNPVWVTTESNTTLYIKYDGDLESTTALQSPCDVAYDVSMSVNALQGIQLYDTDNDQSGLAVYTCDGTKLTAVYGEDPASAVVGSPSLDVGTVIQPMCLSQLIFAEDDYITSLPNLDAGNPTLEYVVVEVLSNDVSFLTTIAPPTVSIAGFLAPSNGIISVNSGGTITYTPDLNYLGNDTFEYQVCSGDDPNLCAVAKVYVTINGCGAQNNENIINGFVFSELSPDDGAYTDELKVQGDIGVDLYLDSNCDGDISGEVIVQSTITDATGNFQFTTIDGASVADDFEANAVIGGGNDGTVNWDNSWQEFGESDGFSAGEVYIGTDPPYGTKLILSGANNSAYREITLSGSSYVAIQFHYRRIGMDDQGEQLLVNFNSYNILTLNDGNTVGTDPIYIYTTLIVPQSEIINGTNTLTFLTNGNTSADDLFMIDNITIDFNLGTKCYITKVNVSNTNGAYSEALLNQQDFSFTEPGNCQNGVALGVTVNIIAEDDNEDVVINTMKTINILNNDIGEIDIANISIYDAPDNGIVEINTDGTIDYTPNTNYTGLDSLDYVICSVDDPTKCDTARVYLNIGCLGINGQVNIFGGVFNDLSNYATLDPTEEYYFSGITINLYEDLNNNGLIDDGVTPTSTTTGTNGAYQFSFLNSELMETVADSFFTNGANNGNDGSQSWSGNWTEIGENDGFGTGDIVVTGNELRVRDSDPVGGEGASREVDLTSATYAQLSYDYQEITDDALDNALDYVAVSVSPNGTDWTEIARHDGADAIISGSVSVVISDFIVPSSTTYVRFLGSDALGNSEGVTFDNVRLEYFVPVDYIIEVDETTLPADYTLTTLDILTSQITDYNTSYCSNDFGAREKIADLSLTKVVDNPNPDFGDTIYFTITVTNGGPDPASTIWIRDLLTTGFTYISTESTIPVGTSYNSYSGVWDLGSNDLTIGSSLQIIIAVKITSDCGTINNFTEIINSSATDPDSTPNNHE